MNQKTVQFGTPTCHFTVLLSPTQRGARLARLLATERLRVWDLPYGVAETAAHLVAELAANAATHGRVPGRDFRLDLRTTDGDRLPAVQPQPPAADGESGRGLLLVEALADRWGVTPGPVPRKTVWAELDLVPPTPPMPLSPPVPAEAAAAVGTPPHPIR